jgi:hypothetical protein
VNGRPQRCTYLQVGEKSKQNEFFSIFNHKILYLTILIVCRKNLNQSDCTECKIVTTEGEKKVLLVGCLDY